MDKVIGWNFCVQWWVDHSKCWRLKTRRFCLRPKNLTQKLSHPSSILSSLWLSRMRETECELHSKSSFQINATVSRCLKAIFYQESILTLHEVWSTNNCRRPLVCGLRADSVSEIVITGRFLNRSQLCCKSCMTETINRTYLMLGPKVC